MKLCRFNRDRLGLVDDAKIFDVTEALDGLAQASWPFPSGDLVISCLDEIVKRAGALRSTARSVGVDQVRLNALVTSPTKIIAAPANYRLHVELDTKDPGVDQGVHRQQLEGVGRPVDKLGLFLKATSSLAGPSDGIVIGLPRRRCDHEVELAVIIGKAGKNISRARARDHIAGYSIGLDITYRGAEDRSFRKSADTFSMIGPWLTTADEIQDPDDLEIWLAVNGEERQRSSTAHLTVGIDELIEIASSMYALHPGDVILTGTPEGVGPIVPGDVITAGAAAVGEMRVGVRGALASS